MALSKNRIKYIRSLELKKNRKADKGISGGGAEAGRRFVGALPLPLSDCNGRMAFRTQTSIGRRHNRSLRRGTLTRQSVENSATGTRRV